MPDCCLIVDVNRLQIFKPKRNQADYYSLKDKYHALKFELVVAIDNPRIIWVNGAFKGDECDIKIARKELIGNLDVGERVLADLGYRGESQHLWTPVQNPRLQAEHDMNRELHRTRQIVERVNQRIKVFDCFKGIWRHDHEYCNRCFNVVSNLVNITCISHPLNE